MFREQFETALTEMLAHAADRGAKSVSVNSGNLHRSVGGYPGRNHRMPICCEVMYARKGDGDRVISAPPKGKGASLTIEYAVASGR